MIGKLKAGTATGLDFVATELLKAVAAEENSPMLELLAVVFSQALKSGDLPVEWQTAVVKPVFKGGDQKARGDWSNYRLISLTSVVGKVFEAVLAERLNLAFEAAGLFAEEQFGFRKGRRCAHAQMLLSEIVKARARLGLNTYVSFLDVRKAYPTAYRAGIMAKLHAMLSKLPGGDCGRQTKIWRVIFKMYERVMSFVRISADSGTADSEEYEVRHGLREGSSLSPTLYAVFINDLMSRLADMEVEEILPGIDLRALMYADDVAIVSANVTDRQRLLKRAGDHADDNQYQFSYKKSKHMVFGDDTRDVEVWLSAHDTGAAPVVMKRCDSYTYLGVEFHESLGAHARALEVFDFKRRYWGKKFLDEDVPDEGPRVFIRVRSRTGADGRDYFVGVSTPLAVLEVSK